MEKNTCTPGTTANSTSVKAIRAIGERFGRLVIVEGTPPDRGKAWYYLCRCDCGNLKNVSVYNLLAGNTTSCGCFKSEVTSKRRRSSLIPIGTVVNNWTVVGGDTVIDSQCYVLVRCSCGTERTILKRTLLTGKSKSCGCGAGVTPNIKHGKHGTYIYNLWKRIKRRCFSKSCKDYPDYGGRGISVYAGWVDNFSEFESFVLSTIGNHPGKGYSLDRVDTNKGYEPGNIRWADATQQANNTRRSKVLLFEGAKVTLPIFCREKGISYQKAYDLIFRRGMSAADALIILKAS